MASHSDKTMMTAPITPFVGLFRRNLSPCLPGNPFSGPCQATIMVLGVEVPDLIPFPSVLFRVCAPGGGQSIAEFSDGSTRKGRFSDLFVIAGNEKPFFAMLGARNGHTECTVC